MTGVEVAGFALSAFPLILSAIDGYHTYIDPVKSLVFYKLRFDDFHRSVTIQSAKFNHSLGELLDPIVPLKIKDELLSNHEGSAWKDPVLTKDLKQTLATDYDAFMSTVQNMNKTLEKLKKGIRVIGNVSIKLLIGKTGLTV